MATFKTVVRRLRPDGSAIIHIRVTQQRQSRYIDSKLVAEVSDLTKDLRLKTRTFIDDAENIIRGYRAKCNKDPSRIARMDVDSLVTFLTKEDIGEDPDFIKFARAEIERLKAAGRTGVAKNHFSTVNAIERHIGAKELPVSAITVKFLRGFEAFIREKPGSDNNKGQSRAPALYLSNLRALHNKMKQAYNDEDAGVIPIPLSPFQRYKLPVEKATRKRALEVDQVKQIYKLPEGGSRFTLARDCFILSFALIGMNSVDLYNCPPAVKGYLTYKRKKTSSRRKDEALISIKITKGIKNLVEKYKDETGLRAFNFYQHYVNKDGFNKSINKGLKEIGKKLKIEDLEFYAARHSWATIALNDCGVDKYTVHSALNHVDEVMRVTDIYLKENWVAINEANRKVLALIEKPEQSPGLSPTNQTKPT